MTTTATPSAPPPASTSVPWYRKLWVLIAAGVVVLALIVAGLLVHQAREKQEAREAAAVQAEAARQAEADAATAERQRLGVLMRAGAGCDLAAYQQVGYSLGDGGTTLTMVTKGNDNSSSITTADLSCVLTAVDAPTRVTSLMDSTRALDGRQSDTWDDITATWSYHPDNGFNLVLTVK